MTTLAERAVWSVVRSVLLFVVVWVVAYEAHEGEASHWCDYPDTAILQPC